MVLEKLVGIIAEQIGGDASEIAMETTFDELEVDSLDIVEIVMKLEEEYEVELDMDQKFETVGDLVKFIESVVG